MRKRLLILWSGGIDSTFLVKEAIQQGHDVETLYVMGIVSKCKEKREMKSINALLKYFKKVYNAEIKHNVVTVDGFDTNPFRLGQSICWIHGILKLTHREKYEEVQIGYVMGDCAISYLKDIKDLYDAYRPHMIPSYVLPFLRFPLTKTEKIEIMNDSGSELIKLCTFCENNSTKDNCGKCPPCIRRKMLELENKTFFSKNEQLKVTK